MKHEVNFVCSPKYLHISKTCYDGTKHSSEQIKVDSGNVHLACRSKSAYVVTVPGWRVPRLAVSAYIGCNRVTNTIEIEEYLNDEQIMTLRLGYKFNARSAVYGEGYTTHVAFAINVKDKTTLHLLKHDVIENETAVVGSTELEHLPYALAVTKESQEGVRVFVYTKAGIEVYGGPGKLTKVKVVDTFQEPSVFRRNFMYTSESNVVLMEIDPKESWALVQVFTPSGDIVARFPEPYPYNPPTYNLGVLATLCTGDECVTILPGSVYARYDSSYVKFGLIQAIRTVH